jgi:hypothetical protein
MRFKVDENLPVEVATIRDTAADKPVEWCEFEKV